MPIKIHVLSLALNCSEAIASAIAVMLGCVRNFTNEKRAGDPGRGLSISKENGGKIQTVRFKHLIQSNPCYPDFSKNLAALIVKSDGQINAILFAEIILNWDNSDFNSKMRLMYNFNFVSK